MLQSIRNNIKGTFAKIILAIMIIPFVGFGAQTFFDNRNAASAIKIDGDELSVRELQLEMQRYRNELLSRMGENVDYSAIEESKLRGPAMERLKQKALIRHAAKKHGLAAPEVLINKMIVNTPAFQEDGLFSQDLLTQLLNRANMTVGDLKKGVSDDINRSQLMAGIYLSAFPLPQEVELYQDMLNEERKVTWVEFPLRTAIDAVELNDEGLAEYFEKNKTRYQTELQVIADYIELKKSDFYEPVNEADLLAEYELQKAAFEPVERRYISHIMREINDEQDASKARESLLEVNQLLVKGESFAKLAETYSQDLGSQTNGGELGYTQGDTFPEAFEEAIALLSEGEVSEPVETDSGLHLIKLNRIEQSEYSSFESLKDSIAVQLQRRRAETPYVEASEQLADLVFNAEDLTLPADEMSLTVNQSATFSAQKGEGLFADSRIREAVFDEEVIEGGLNSKPVELSPEHMIVLRVNKVLPARQQELDEVKEEVIAQYKQEQAAVLLDQWLVEAKSSLQDASSASIKSFAEARQLPFQESQTIGWRLSQSVDPALLQDIFARAKSEFNALQEYEAISGSRYMYIVESSSIGNTELSEIERRSLASSLQRVLGERDFSGFIDSVEQSVSIETF